MFAVIKTGGKQYSVAADDQLKVERLAGEPGDMIQLNEVLMVGNTVGTPLVEGAMVTAEIVEQGRARKVIAFKKRRRQNSRRTIGHRQHYTMLQISEILTDGAKPTKKSAGIGKQRAEARAANKAAAAGNDSISEADAAPAEAEAKPTAKKEAAPAAPKEDAKKVEAKADKPKAEKKEAPASDAPSTAPAGGEKDKLTDIKGIGPVAEKQLNEQGITTFAQIAALSDEDIVKVDEYMPFSADQINDWKAQAQEKAKG